MKNQTAKQRVQSVYPDAHIIKSQIQFQTTYNVKCSEGNIAYGFTEKGAWDKAVAFLVSDIDRLITI